MRRYHKIAESGGEEVWADGEKDHKPLYMFKGKWGGLDCLEMDSGFQFHLSEVDHEKALVEGIEI